MNNGGCYPDATCEPIPNLGQNAVECTCPPGYSGNGFGPEGCVYSPTCEDTCDSVGGWCFLGDCTCYSGWAGENCDIPGTDFYMH